MSGDGAPAGLPGVAVIVPVLNEARALAATLESVCCQAPEELVVVDGGSGDGTPEIARAALAAAGPGTRWTLMEASRGRALQMNAGAAASRSPVLLFLHGDTRLPEGGLERVRRAVARGALWGRFRLRLEDARPVYRLIETTMEWRSRLSGIVTGDQTFFVRRDLFELMRGFPSQPLMEDIAFSKRLNTVARPVVIDATVLTAARRWQQGGVFRTILQMWSLRALYALGVSPRRLAGHYRDLRES